MSYYIISSLIAQNLRIITIGVAYVNKNIEFSIIDTAAHDTGAKNPGFCKNLVQYRRP